MLSNIFIKLKEYFGQSETESWIFVSLATICVLAFLIFVCLIFSKKIAASRIRKSLIVLYFLLTVAFMTVGITAVSGFLEKANIHMLFKLQVAYKNRWILSLHIASFVIFFTSLCILLIKGKNKLSATNFEVSKKQSDRAYFKRNAVYFSQFDAGLEDDGNELLEVRDIFREIGNNESDVSAYINRMSKKLIEQSPNSKNKIDEISDILSKKQRQ